MLNAGTGSDVMSERFSVRMPRDTHSNGLEIGITWTAASIPRLRISPPLKNSPVKPVDGASARCSSRSLIVRW